MTWIEIFLIAVSLCFDTLTVSLIGGACISGIDWKKVAGIAFSFAFFQGGLTFAGWLLGASVDSYIARYDHWVAFALLAFIGGRMVKESFSGKESASSVNLLNAGSLILASIATSIDAFAVGISFAMSGDFTIGRIAGAVATIAAVTAAAAVAGLCGGRRIGNLLGPRCNLVGGCVLIAIGIRILIGHLI